MSEWKMGIFPSSFSPPPEKSLKNLSCFCKVYVSSASTGLLLLFHGSCKSDMKTNMSFYLSVLQHSIAIGK